MCLIRMQVRLPWCPLLWLAAQWEEPPSWSILDGLQGYMDHHLERDPLGLRLQARRLRLTHAVLAWLRDQELHLAQSVWWTEYLAWLRRVTPLVGHAEPMVAGHWFERQCVGWDQQAHMAMFTLSGKAWYYPVPKSYLGQLALFPLPCRRIDYWLQGLGWRTHPLQSEATQWHFSLLFQRMCSSYDFSSNLLSSLSLFAIHPQSIYPSE